MRRVKMKRKMRGIKRQWLIAMVAGVLLLAGCGGGGGGSDNSGGGDGTPPVDTADARFEFTLTSFDPDAMVPAPIPGGLSAPAPTQAMIELIEGTILAVNQVTGEEHEFSFAVEVDPAAFEVTDIELPLPPGTYDVFFLMTSGSFQYAAITGSWIILEGQNVVPMLIAPLIGDTVSDLDQLKNLMEFEFTFTPEEVQKLQAAADPQFSISVDGDPDPPVFSINPATGLTTAFAVLEAGTYQFEVKFFDGDVEILESQVITVIVPEEGGKTSIDVKLNPTANAGLAQSVRPGDIVTLLGNDSSTSGGSLTYQWSFVSKPALSNAQLIGADTVNPTFEADVEGDYVLQLTVTDANGLTNDTRVTVTTFNTTPVADPGEDDAIIVIDETVEVDGTPSFDEDGDTFTYSWTITSPDGSEAVLDDPASPTPTFVADVKGTYVLTLVVTDQFGAVSEEQTVTFTFENVVPNAVASADQPSVDVGTEVTLSGANSSDANMDELTYLWSQTSGPDVTLMDPEAMEASFTPTEPGTYIFSLVVNDGEADSEPFTITVEVNGNQHPAIDILRRLIGVIENDLQDGDFKHSQHRKTLVNKIQSVIHKLDEGKLESAKNKLEGDILAKVDGCATSGQPDKHDWIVNCPAQGDEPGEVYPLVNDAIQSIEDSLAGS